VVISDWFAKKRLAFLLIILITIFVALIFRLSWLQLVQGSELGQKAMQVRAGEDVLEPVRGIIYDRNHTELVVNSPAKSVYLNADIFSVAVKNTAGEDKEEKQKAEKERVIRQIAAILGLNEDNTVSLMKSEQPFIWLKHRVDYRTCEILSELINENKVTGIGMLEGTMRSYPQGTMAAHVLGFVGLDPSARGGIEKSYNRELSGTPGRRVAEKDASGRELPQTTSFLVPPLPGKNLVLTLDYTIQFYVEHALDQIEEKYKPARSTIIIMDPKTGEILALGARPGYDPAKYSSYPQQVWDFNPALRFNYEPGSTFKMFIASAALEEGVVHEGDHFYDPGYVKVLGERINCWDLAGHGDQSFIEGFMNSCNTVFVQTGLKMGKALIYKYVRGFGFGRSTGIDLPGEDIGLLIPEEEASELDYATMSMGQSIAVTPIQLITAVSAIANGGYLFKPYIVKTIEDPENKTARNIEPQMVRQVISRNTAGQMARFLQKVVLEGTAKKAYVDGYMVGAKTGTAEVAGRQGYAEGKYVSSIAGFAPLDDPRIAILIVVSEPKGEQYQGGDVAAPVFSTLTKDILHYLNVPEDPDVPKQENPPGVVENDDLPDEAGEMIRVPDIIGFPITEAGMYLEELGLKPVISGENGLVGGQDPGAGSYAKKGDAVKIQATDSAAGENEVLVPDLTGLTIKRAGIILQQLGLEFKPGGSGYAINQSPRAGERVPKGSVVTVEFSPPNN